MSHSTTYVDSDADDIERQLAEFESELHSALSASPSSKHSQDHFNNPLEQNQSSSMKDIESLLSTAFDSATTPSEYTSHSPDNNNNNNTLTQSDLTPFDNLNMTTGAHFTSSDGFHSGLVDNGEQSNNNDHGFDFDLNDPNLDISTLDNITKQTFIIPAYNPVTGSTELQSISFTAQEYAKYEKVQNDLVQGQLKLLNELKEHRKLQLDEKGLWDERVEALFDPSSTEFDLLRGEDPTTYIHDPHFWQYYAHRKGYCREEHKDGAPCRVDIALKEQRSKQKMTNDKHRHEIESLYQEIENDETLCGIVRRNELHKFHDVIGADMYTLKSLISSTHAKLIKDHNTKLSLASPPTSLSAEEMAFIRATMPGNVKLASIRPHLGLFVVDKDGNNCIHWIVLQNALDFFHVILNHLNTPLLYPLLLNLLNTKNNKGETPLQWAVFQGNLFFVQILLTYGAIPFIRTTAHSTTFHNIARKGDILLFEFFYTLYLDQEFRFGSETNNNAIGLDADGAKMNGRKRNHGKKQAQGYKPSPTNNPSSKSNRGLLSRASPNSLDSDLSDDDNNDDNVIDPNVGSIDRDRSDDVMSFLKERLFTLSQLTTLTTSPSLQRFNDSELNTYNILQPLHRVTFAEPNGKDAQQSTPPTTLLTPNSRFPSTSLLDHLTTRYRPLNPIPYLHHYCSYDDIIAFTLNSPDKNGKTPLHWASYNSHSFAVQWLLKYKANIYAQDNERCYPLHWAVMRAHNDCITTLTNHLSTLSANDIIMMMEESTLTRRQFGLLYQDVAKAATQQQAQHSKAITPASSSLSSPSSHTSLQADSQDDGELNTILKLGGLVDDRGLNDGTRSRNGLGRKRAMLQSSVLSLFGITYNPQSENLGLLQFKHIDYTGMDCFQLVNDKLTKFHEKNGTTMKNFKLSNKHECNDCDDDDDDDDDTAPGYNPALKADIEKYTKVMGTIKGKFYKYSGKDELWGAKVMAEKFIKTFMNNAFVLLTLFIYTYGPYSLYTNVSPIVAHHYLLNSIVNFLWFVLPLSMYCWYRAAFCNGGLIASDPTLDSNNLTVTNQYLTGCSDLNQFGLNDHYFLTQHWTLYLKTLDMNERIRDEVELGRQLRPLHSGDENNRNDQPFFSPSMDQTKKKKPATTTPNSTNSNPSKFARFTNPYLAIINHGTKVESRPINPYHNSASTSHHKSSKNKSDRNHPLAELNDLESHSLAINSSHLSPITSFPADYMKYIHNTPTSSEQRGDNGFLNCLFNCTPPRFHSLFFLPPNTYQASRNLDVISRSNSLARKVYDEQCFFEVDQENEDDNDPNADLGDLDDLDGSGKPRKSKKQGKATKLNDFLNNTSSPSNSSNSSLYDDDIDLTNTEIPDGYPFNGEYRVPMLKEEGLGRGQYAIPQTLFSIPSTSSSPSPSLYKPSPQTIKPRFYTAQQVEFYTETIRSALSQPQLRESYFATIQRFVQLSQLYTNPAALLMNHSSDPTNKDKNDNNGQSRVDSGACSLITMSRTMDPSPPLASHFTKMLASAVCLTCGIERPVRSKHCREVNMCVHRFDHFCPFLNNVVGGRNYRWFVFWLISVLCLAMPFIILCLVTLKSLISIDVGVLAIQLNQMIIDNPDLPSTIPSTFIYPPALIGTIHNLTLEELHIFTTTAWYYKVLIIAQDFKFIPILFFILLCTGVVAIAYSLLSFHTQLILSNLTTNEYVNKDRYGYLLMSSELPYNSKQHENNINGQNESQIFINPYGYHLTTNLKAFFGLNRYDPWCRGLMTVWWADLFGPK